MKPFFAIVLFVLSANIATAQTSTDSVAPAKTQFVMGLSYNSALNYYGRTDTLKSKGINPFIGILFKNGLYLASNMVFVNNITGTRYAATIVEAGYRFDNGHWGGNLSGSQFFYNDDALVQSVVHQQLAFNLTNTNNVLNVTMGADVKFSDQADFGALAGVDHRIQFGNKVIIQIDPSAFAYAGTQNFTKSYLQQNKFLMFPVSQQVVTKNSRQFSILSYELSCPLTLAIGKMNLIVTPAYVLPQNYIAVQDQQATSQQINNLFYTTTTLRFTF